MKERVKMLPKMIRVGGPYGKFKTEIVDENGQSVATVITKRIEDKTAVPDERGEAILHEMVWRWNIYHRLISQGEPG